MILSNSLYFKTGNNVYLEKMNYFYEKGAKLAKGPLLVLMQTLTSKKGRNGFRHTSPEQIQKKATLPVLDLRGISELYPSIKLNSSH